jgi:hypothetical protein
MIVLEVVSLSQRPRDPRQLGAFPETADVG